MREGSKISGGKKTGTKQRFQQYGQAFPPNGEFYFASPLFGCQDCDCQGTKKQSPDIFAWGTPSWNLLLHFFVLRMQQLVVVSAVLSQSHERSSAFPPRASFALVVVVVTVLTLTHIVIIRGHHDEAPATLEWKNTSQKHEKHYTTHSGILAHLTVGRRSGRTPPVRRVAPPVPLAPELVPSGGRRWRLTHAIEPPPTAAATTPLALSLRDCNVRRVRSAEGCSAIHFWHWGSSRAGLGGGVC